MSWSDEGSGFGIGLIILVLLALLGFGGMLLAPDYVSAPTVSNETSALGSLVLCLSAQSVFHKHDHYGIGRNVYANPDDGNGFVDLRRIGFPDPSGRKVALIDRALANAGRRVASWPTDAEAEDWLEVTAE